VKPILRLIPPQRVADSDQVAPLQYSINDTARLMGFSRRTILRMLDRGELSSVGRGKLRRVPYDSIVAWLNRNRNDGEAA
jgi:excisionase family DNA binding protein